jgi:hypothetical protein
MEGFNDQLVPGSSLRISPVAQVSRIRHRCRFDAGHGDRGKRRGFQCFERADPAAVDVPDASTLYTLERASDKDTNLSYPDYLDLRDRNQSFDGLTAYGITQVALNTGGDPSLIWGVESSGNYFDTLRIQPYLGRFFHASDDRGPNSAPYIVLSYAYWHSHFHDDRGIVGRFVQMNHDGTDSGLPVGSS